MRSYSEKKLEVCCMYHLRTRKVFTVIMTLFLSMAMVLTMIPQLGLYAYAEGEGSFTLQTPVLTVTGTGLLDEGAYNTTNVSAEKSYTLPELKEMSDGNEYIYSAKKQQSPYTESFHAAVGVDLSLLVAGLRERSERISIIADDGYVSTFMKGSDYYNVEGFNVNGVGSLKKQALEDIAPTVGFDQTRYWYEDFNAELGEEVPSIIAWNYEEGANGAIPVAGTTDKNLRLYVGQLGGEGYDGPKDMNGPLLNGGSKAAVNRVLVGSEIDEIVLTVGNQAYTRADLLMLPFAVRTYSYETQGGAAEDTARGIPLSVLLEGQDDDAVVTFHAADNYDVTATGMTVGELIAGNYMLAYEVNGAGVYAANKKDPSQYGFLTLYGDDAKPGKMIDSVKAEKEDAIDFSTSPYKHVTNGGISGQNAPYNIDGITGATLTIEGPGVKTSVPLSVRDMESRSAGYDRGVYTDVRNSSETARTYEGMDLYYLLHNMSSGSSGIILTDNAYQVTIKNRNRQAISTFTLADIEKAHNDKRPILIAYGTAYEDGTSPAPFVFDGGVNLAPDDLGNEDGCLKLVYDTSEYDGHNPSYTKFTNMAYVYVEEAEQPGFKHTVEGSPYNIVDNTQAIISVTGDTLGREVNYTIKDIEDMVKYDDDGNVADNGFGFRDSYSLTNTTYWYVNEYEGVKLWSLLLNSGLDPALSDDGNTIVNYLTTDNYGGTDKFSLKQIADDDSFGFYEKNALDDNTGSYVPNENIRVNDDPETGDKLGVGYPVLLAYGVNGYPYVINSKLDGYLSGLSNDGGPVRVISGKTNYKHNNGSSQAQKLSGIVVGTNNYHYASHKYHSDAVYTALADNELAVSISTEGSETSSTKTYTIGQIEDIVYDGSLTATQLNRAKVKAKYSSGKYSDLYEGVSLPYFLQEVVELSGSEGTITFTNAEGSTLSLQLADVLAMDNGYNADTGVSGLVPIIAYGKNGAPLVNKNAPAPNGYISSETLGEGTEFEHSVDIKNQGGPLQVMIPATPDGGAVQVLSDVVSIDIDLESDKYAHTSAPYDTYADREITFSGTGTNLTEPKTFKVSDIEAKQTLAGTYDYSLLNKAGTTITSRFRGIKLYDFLKSSNVGLKSSADKVIVTSSDGFSKEFSMADIIRTDYVNTEDASVTELPVLLAFGSASVTNEDRKDGKPLVTDDESAGYDSAYGNTGGPVRFVIGQSDASDVNNSKCISDVASIEVTASEITNWNHSSSSTFASYLDRKVSFIAVDKDNNEVFSKDVTVQELEAMTDLIDRAVLHIDTDNEWEGLNFFGTVKTVMGNIAGIDNPVSIRVEAADGFGYNVMEQGLDVLQNGVKDGSNYYPVLLAYGVDGTPLAQFGKNDPAGPGYDSTLGNGNGPIRLVIHNAGGKSAGNVVKITVKLGEGGDEPPVPEDADFTIASNKLEKPATFSVAQLKKLDAAEKEYTARGVTDKVRGVALADLLRSVGLTYEGATFDIEADGYDGKGTYKNILLSDAIAQEYFVAYEVYDAETEQWTEINDVEKTPNSKVRIYRNYTDPEENVWYNKCQYITGITVTVPEVTEFDTFPGGMSEGSLPVASIRATFFDKDGNLWVGTYGGGAAYKAKGSDAFVVYNLASEPALSSSYVSAIYPDDDGGVYMSQNASYTDPTANTGMIYMKDGEITSFRAPDTVPNDYVQEIKIDKDGIVWIGSFGGLTRYDPKAGTWQTWDKDDGFPAMSIDNIEFDGQGGIWCGFYPDSEASDGTAAFEGGFAYFKDGQVVKSYTYTSPQDANTGAFRLGDVWIRDIAVDKNGGTWVVASGSYGGMANTGGRVFYISSPGAEAVDYTGFELFGEDAFSTDSELRMVTVDPDGGLWFGTSGDGVFYAAEPVINDGKLTLTEQYSSATGSWEKASFDNVYSLDFHGSTLYSGSNGGLATHEFTFENGGDEPEVTPAGDATADDADLTITGPALSRDGYFSIKGIKNTSGIDRVDATFKWMKSSGETGTTTVQGATLENIFDYIGLAEGAVISSVEIVSADGHTVTYTAKEALDPDMDGNKAMFIWNDSDEGKVQKVILGQFSEDYVNKGKWAKDAVTIKVYAETEQTAEDIIEAISAIPDAEEITVADAQAIISAREAYNALSKEEQAKVTNYDKLVAAEEALEEVLREDYKSRGGDLVDSIDYSDYSAVNATGLWLNISRLESKLEKAATADEAAEIYKKMEDAVNNTKTLKEEALEDLNEFPVEVTASSKSYNSITLSWTDIPKAGSYTVYRGEAPDGEFEEIKSLPGTTYKDTGLKTGKKYFYVVAPKSRVKGEYVYGNSSEMAAASPVLAKTKVTLKAGSKKADVRWKKVAGANGYVIYRSTKKSSGFKKVRTISKGTTVKITNTKLKAGKTYYYKVKAYRVVDGKKVYSAFSPVKGVKIRK